jgi:hypothetical protein
MSNIDALAKKIQTEHNKKLKKGQPHMSWKTALERARAQSEDRRKADIKKTRRS